MGCLPYDQQHYVNIMLIINKLRSAEEDRRRQRHHCAGCTGRHTIQKLRWSKTKYHSKKINMDVKSVNICTEIYTILSRYSWPRFSGFCDPRKPGSPEGVQGEKI